MSKANNQCIRLNKALDLLHRSGARLMLMKANDGDHFYIVPGGRVDRSDAQEILNRPDVITFDDGLFPNSPQSWRLIR